MNFRTRFAPSPTGHLHLGHAYAAWFAKEHGSEFFLRFEDIDHTRVRDEYFAATEEDLTWLGLAWEGEVWRQTDRMSFYRDALETLKGLGVVYPCTCTRRQVQEALANAELNAPHGSPETRYPGTCRTKLGQSLSGPAAWRLHWEKAIALTGPLTFSDQRFGDVDVDPSIQIGRAHV